MSLLVGCLVDRRLEGRCCMVVSQERRDWKTFWEILASWCAHSKVGNKVPVN